MSTSRSPVGGVDPLEMLDLSEYDTMPYQSPSVSPASSNKPQFGRPTAAMARSSSLMPPNQVLSGPSHQYDQYKQQTPFVPGALASTLAINENNVHITGYNLEYINPGEELFDFNSAPSQNSLTPDMDLDFDSPAEQAFFYPPTPSTSMPQHGLDMRSPTVPSTVSNVGKMYPGMHQQAALAKAQAQQRQQQQIIQHQQRSQQQLSKPQPRSKAALPADPLVEQKITQLLNSMRSRVASSEDGDDSPILQINRPKKDEDEMDEDERLLASEEGKKLSSKERRQLRNKVSARAFRSRRKEYIGQLESEIAGKVTENSELRAQNRALMDENRRLTDLTRMLLASDSFSDFLDHLSRNPTVPAAQPRVEQRQPEPQRAPKDVNAYNGTSQNQHQQIGMVMMPEQTMDFSMLNLNNDVFNYQPQVFAVLETPEPPVIDTDTLRGKSSNFVGQSSMEESDKADAPVFEAPIAPVLEKSQSSETPAAVETVAAKKPANLDADIFDDEGISAPSPTPIELDTEVLNTESLFGGLESEKALARYELTEASEEEATTIVALRRIERLTASIESTITRLERFNLE
ncbi:hypothetical protein F5Y18DRAFT_383463 [Xylariaceae sp. FL1019]|nr:hypothetical protein F5Y18DRAFT_383463 [Xylariaceae sp. FL1019]